MPVGKFSKEFEPKFIELFEKTGSITGRADAKYTLIFHTTSTDPGFKKYITKKNAEIDAVVTVIETKNRTKKIAILSVRHSPGRLLWTFQIFFQVFFYHIRLHFLSY